MKRKNTRKVKTSIERIGFEPKTQLFEKYKTRHALDRAVIVMDKPNAKVMYGEGNFIPRKNSLSIRPWRRMEE
jgi:hypothetical protein